MNQIEDKYTYRVTWSEEDGEYVGLCSEFPSLSWLAGAPGKALFGILKAVKEVIVDMEKSGEELPQPYSCRNFSGKFQVRIPPEAHRNLVVQAADSGVSLNRYISQKLA